MPQKAADRIMPYTLTAASFSSVTPFHSAALLHTAPPIIAAPASG
jgi:hypothetical protein